MDYPILLHGLLNTLHINMYFFRRIDNIFHIGCLSVHDFTCKNDRLPVQYVTTRTAGLPAGKFFRLYIS